MAQPLTTKYWFEIVFTYHRIKTAHNVQAKEMPSGVEAQQIVESAFKLPAGSATVLYVRPWNTGDLAAEES